MLTGSPICCFQHTPGNGAMAGADRNAEPGGPGSGSFSARLPALGNRCPRSDRCRRQGRPGLRDQGQCLGTPSQVFHRTPAPSPTGRHAADRHVQSIRSRRESRRPTACSRSKRSDQRTGCARRRRPARHDAERLPTSALSMCRCAAPNSGVEGRHVTTAYMSALVQVVVNHYAVVHPSPALGQFGARDDAMPRTTRHRGPRCRLSVTVTPESSASTPAK